MCIVFVIVIRLLSSVILLISGLVSKKWNVVSNVIKGFFCGCGGIGSCGSVSSGNSVINVLVVVSL